MTSAQPPTGTGVVDMVAATLRPLLGAQFQRLRRRYFWHGIGVLTGLLGLALLLFFGLDHTLRLPLPVRLLHTTVIIGLAVLGGLRFLRYPMTRRFDDVELAAWVERTFPELHQRLVSALQLHDTPAAQLRNQSPAMIGQMVAETAAMATRLPLDRLFDDRRTRRILGGAMLVTLVIAVAIGAAPGTARAFVLRHLGIAADYPRETHLQIELPPSGPDLQRQDREGLSELVLPAGADLHVSVLVEGTVPKDVYLDVTSRRDEAAVDAEPRSITMTPRPPKRFRYVFRRLSGTFEFHARGGDDDHGDRTVIVRTIHPPQVATLRATIRPPSYTHIESLEQAGGAIEALLGSEVALTLSTTATVRQATMVCLESGRRFEMQPLTLQDDSGAAVLYRCAFTIEGSDRYQIELLAENGLRNPNPGTYPIAALQDYAPVGRWLLPDDDVLLLPTALLCVRIDVKDDFGLQAIDFAVDRSGTRSLQRSLLATPTTAAGAGDATAPPAAGTTSTILTELLEVSELLGAKDPAAATAGGNDGLVLQTILRDNREPEANSTELPRRIVQIVDAPQLAAAIAKSFRTLREEIGQAAEIQTDRRGRLQELLARTDPTPGELAQVLTNIEVGQGRVGNACERAHRGLMRAFDQHLWNRLEPSQHAAAVVEIYRQRSLLMTQPLGLDPAFYRDLQQRRIAGTLGSMETTLDPILNMVMLADRIVTSTGPEAVRLLAEAQVARDANDRRPLLERAELVQSQIEQALQQLLLRLEEWNDYQDLIQETRALRDRQRDLQGRTDEARGKK